MRFTDASRLLGLATSLLLAACTSPRLAPVAGPGPGQLVPPLPAMVQQPTPFVLLPSAGTPRTQNELARHFAQRVVQANPGASYLTPAPSRLFAIPVLEVELNADGSVRKINVLRHPSTGDESTQRAIAAVQKAAPFGPVGHLPRPWKVIEAFLFDDELRFKPRQLDLP